MIVFKEKIENFRSHKRWESCNLRLGSDTDKWMTGHVHFHFSLLSWISYSHLVGDEGEGEIWGGMSFKKNERWRIWYSKRGYANETKKTREKISDNKYRDCINLWNSCARETREKDGWTKILSRSVHWPGPKSREALLQRRDHFLHQRFLSLLTPSLHLMVGILRMHRPKTVQKLKSNVSLPSFPP